MIAVSTKQHVALSVVERLGITPFTFRMFIQKVLTSEAATELESVRRHTRDLIESAATDYQPVLVEAPPNSKRAIAACELASHLHTPVTYLTDRTDSSAQVLMWRRQSDLSSKMLPVPQLDCPTFADDSSRSTITAHRFLNKGYSMREIHRNMQVYTPCLEGGSHCDFLQELDETTTDAQDIDIFIGNQNHIHYPQYLDGRVVILDGFNPTPFQTHFPPESAIDTRDALGEIIPYFLEALDAADEAFPTDALSDVTDLIEKRHDPDIRDEALTWFQKHGISKEDARNFDFYPATSYRYDATHLLAPFLTCSLLCMQKISPEIGLAPPLEGPLREEWLKTGIDPDWGCVRNRNTGAMVVCHPPDLSGARQVIGLDTIPTVELWNLLFARDTEFNHRQVIKRNDFGRYLSEALNMTTVQIGDGMHHYAGGRMSKVDERRFASIRARDGRFALITTKSVLDQCEEEGWLAEYVKGGATDKGDEDGGGSLLARNYATILDSPDFMGERVGAVFGSPYPGDEVVKQWAGFCGHSVTSEGSGPEKSFGEFGDEIYHHFAHHRVLRAVCQFAQHEPVRENDGANVYISTQTLPEWFDVANEFTIHQGTKETAIIEQLILAMRSAKRPQLASETVGTLTRKAAAREDINGLSETHVRTTLNTLVSDGYVSVRRDAGRGGADLYRWGGDGSLDRIDTDNFLLVGKDKAYILVVDSE